MINEILRKIILFAQLLIVFSLYAGCQNSNKNSLSGVDSTKKNAEKLEILWAVIPAGTYKMGSPASEFGRDDNETLHDVTLSAFKMSKYEISVAQFKSFIVATGYVTDAEKGAGNVEGSAIWMNKEFKIKEGVNWKYDVFGNLLEESRYNNPVIHVSWNDAKAFADWMGCRLPTEAEWEYACRAGTQSAFHTGNNLTTTQANYNGKFPYEHNAKGEYREKLLPVGSFAPNAWGLYDMHGNVSEWCNDWYDTYQTTAQTNPQGPAAGTLRVVRSGAWGANAKCCRSAFRFRSIPVSRSFMIGIRIVKNN